MMEKKLKLKLFIVINQFLFLKNCIGKRWKIETDFKYPSNLNQ